mmetsp:Transcript_17039/g.44905  ORF Transcript_17039/g.44905 Transcript_17039/m.44905 type:complete len:378 (-) Transcript_17039:854-1987(-)
MHAPAAVPPGEVGGGWAPARRPRLVQAGGVREGGQVRRAVGGLPRGPRRRVGAGPSARGALAARLHPCLLLHACRARGCRGHVDGGPLAAAALHPALDARLAGIRRGAAVECVPRGQPGVCRRCARAAAQRQRPHLGAGLSLDAAAVDAQGEAQRRAHRLVPPHALLHVRDVPHTPAPRGDPARRAGRGLGRLPYLRLRAPLPHGVLARAGHGRRGGGHGRQRGHLRPRVAPLDRGRRLPDRDRALALRRVPRDGCRARQDHRPQPPLRRQKGDAGHRPARLRQGHPAQAQGGREVPAEPPFVDGQDRPRPDRRALAHRGARLPEAAQQRAQARHADQRRVRHPRGRAHPLPRPVHVLPGAVRALLPRRRHVRHLAP